MAVGTDEPDNLRLKAGLTIGLLLLLAVNWLPQLDALAQSYLSDTVASNATVFAVVRSLNGVISVIQSADVGVGVASISLGEIFDPLNDLIERFSWLLLVSLTALGIQQVLLLFTTSVTVKAAFSLYALASLILLWKRPAMYRGWIRWVLLVILLRFLLNLEVALVWCFDWFYFNATGSEALSVLEAATQVIQNIKDSITDIDLGKLIFGDDNPPLDNESVGQEISTSVITLIVGILFKSLIIPIGTIWAGANIAKAHLRAGA